MFVDACAIESMFVGEESAAEPFTSALAAWDAIIVLSRPDQLNCRYSDAEAVVVEWLDVRNIALRETGAPRQLLSYAVAVAEQHGIGRRSLSNFDCFHYAHAKVAQQSLLTMDRLLRQTDLPTLP